MTTGAIRSMSSSIFAIVFTALKTAAAVADISFVLRPVTICPSGSSIVINRVVDNKPSEPVSSEQKSAKTMQTMHSPTGSSVVINIMTDSKPSMSGNLVEENKSNVQTTHGPTGSSVVITKNISGNSTGVTNSMGHKPSDGLRPTFVNVLPTKSEMLEDTKMPNESNDSSSVMPDEQKRKFRPNVINVPIKNVGSGGEAKV